jgi:hypothetical protein
MPNHRACDRCHKYKQKCKFDDRTQRCRECERSATACATLRTQVRQGRRPQAKSIGPKGSIHIWQIESTESTSIIPKESESFVGSVTPGSSKPPSEVTVVDYGDFESIPGMSPDSHTDETYDDLIYQTSTSSNSLYDEQPISARESPFHPDSPGLIYRFYKNFHIFMLGPSFAADFRLAIKRSYTCSPSLLHDVMRGLETVMVCLKRNTRSSREIDFARGSSSLRKLRTACVTGIEDAVAIIGLGQTLAAFDLLTNCSGSLFILRYSLACTLPWCEKLLGNALLNPVTITPIFWETVCCLVKRDIPIIRYISTDPHIVDRTAGLCMALLPIFYDLCVAINALKYQLEMDSNTNTSPIGKIQERLISWVPESPSHFASGFSNQEILKMEGQASMYRTAGMLVCHRVMNPIGTSDDVASSYALSIIIDFSNYSALIEAGTKLQNVVFPIFMAALEIPNLSTEIWNMVSLSAAAPMFIAKVSALVKYVWAERHCGSTRFLFDIVDDGPAFIVIP